MLRFEDAEVTRGDFTLQADFAVPHPGLTAVIGPSGGGKSTLLSLIAGFDLPDQGQVSWNDIDLAPYAPGERPVTMLFQDGNLFPHLDIVTNIALGVEPVVRPDDTAKVAALEALERVGLNGFAMRKPGDLSGGQQSRAALARVLLTERPVVLMDEAFSALGPALRRDMLDLTEELLGDATILMVTHDPDDALDRASQTIFVNDGHAHSPRDTKALFDDPPETLAAYLA